jgi:hypothetical protein
MHACMRTHARARTHTHTCTRARTHAHTCKHTTHAGTPTHTHPPAHTPPPPHTHTQVLCRLLHLAISAEQALSPMYVREHILANTLSREHIL